MRPTVFLGHCKDDGSPWSHRDRALAEALIFHESLKCPGCGHPAHEARDPDRLGWYNVDSIVCTACNAKAKAEMEGSAEPGTYLRVSLDPAYVKRS